MRAAMRGLWFKGGSSKLCVKIASWDDSDVREERAVPGDRLKSAFVPLGDGEEMVRFKDPTHFIDNRTCAPAVCDGRGVTSYMYIETLTYTHTHTHIYIYIYIYIYFYAYVYMHIYVCICIYIYTYVYISVYPTCL
jgi:hypothetical protein